MLQWLVFDMYDSASLRWCVCVCVVNRCFVLVPAAAAAAQGPQAKADSLGKSHLMDSQALQELQNHFSSHYGASSLVFLFGDENEDMVQIYSFNIYP